MHCNFCSENEAIPDIGLFGFYHVVCPICGAQGPPCDTETEAVEAWNKCGEKTRAAYIKLARLVIACIRWGPEDYDDPKGETGWVSAKTFDEFEAECKRLASTPESEW
jgi:hypothetical protein